MRTTHAGARAVGRGPVDSRGPFPNPVRPLTAPLAGVRQRAWRPITPTRSGRATRSTSGDIMNGLPPRRGRRQLQRVRPLSRYAGHRHDVTGEVGDCDFYDAAGALLFPVERMRRWVTPADINGTGSVDHVEPRRQAASTAGADASGRVEFNSYFRPPGSPGVINTNYTVDDHADVTTVDRRRHRRWARSISRTRPRRRPTRSIRSGPANSVPPIATALAVSDLPARHDQQPAARLRVVPVPEPEPTPAQANAELTRSRRSNIGGIAGRRELDRRPRPADHRRRQRHPDRVSDLRLRGQRQRSTPTA